MAQNRAERLQGTVEHRAVGITDFELRAVGNTLKFSGYASLFNSPYEMYGGPDKGGWTETVDRRAFDITLARKPDVVLNINHGEGGTGLPLARTTSGTLQLATDRKGLRPTAELDLRDPDVQALQVKVERGDVDQMSFAFRTIRQEWNQEETDRVLTELSLDRGDVSIVTNGANANTSVQLRTLEDALAMLARAEPGQLVEARGLGSIVAAQKVLAQALSQRGDDSDPGSVAQAVDAALDSAEDELIAGNYDQALALIQAAGLSVDALLMLLGVVDTDEPRSLPVLGEPRSPIVTGRISVAVAERLLLLDA